MNATRTRRVAIYSRVSTTSQTTENQIRELRQVAERHGWQVVAEYTDEGVSGAKGRDKRPGYDALMLAVSRREIDQVVAWSLDRVGRSMRNLIDFLEEIQAKKVDLYLHRQGIDTSTPAGKMFFHFLGAVAEFERELIRERVNAGLARAKAQGKTLGRPRRDDAKRLTAVRKLRKEGVGINKIAKQLGIGVSAVQRIVSAG